MREKEAIAVGGTIYLRKLMKQSGLIRDETRSRQALNTDIEW